MLLALAAQIPVWQWTVDDAAISFAYARNLAAGEGLVAQPGGERVEGYSNPSWVLLLSLWEAAGIQGFAASKLMGALFAVLCVPLAWRIARWSRPDRDEAVPLLAAGALATNVTFAIWNTSGLENSLFSLLLAAATWCTLLETRTRRFPLSALLFFGVAVTRPEGILYAAVGGFAALAFSLQDRRGAWPTLAWLLVFFVPFGAYHALRFHYFAWPLPNTYYAKLADASATPLAWNGRGWSYLRDYAGLSFSPGSPGPGLGVGYLLPVFLIGALGTAGRRGRLALGLTGGTALLLLLPGPPELTPWPAIDPGAWGVRWGLLDEPESWLRLRAVGLVTVAVIVPFAAAGRRGGRALALCWGLAATSVFFAVGSRGDWMKGYRWLSLLAVPAAVLFAAGLGELRDWARRRERSTGLRATFLRTAVVALPLLLWVLPQLRHLLWLAWRTPTSTISVGLRVDYVHDLMDTLRLEHATVLDMDMGVHLYRSRAQMVDMAGLVDVPIAHHHYDPDFLSEYLFRERRPAFAHVHGAWAKRTGIPDHPEWARDYLSLPGYLSRQSKVHAGDHIRRDLLFAPEGPGDDGRTVAFRGGFVLAGWELPGLPAAPGLNLAVAVGLAGPAAPDRQVEIFLSGPGAVIAHRDVTPAYGWLPRSAWRSGEVFRGHFRLELGPGTRPGVYDLGFVVRDPSGTVIPAIPSPEGEAHFVVGGWRGEQPAVARGEVRFPAAVRVVPFEQLLAHTDADRAALAERAAELRCADADADWQRIRARFVGHPDRLSRWKPGALRDLAACWARSALGSHDPRERLDSVVRAREIDHRSPPVREAARRIAAAFFEEGETARGRGEWDEAYRLFSAAVRADPSLAWARRYAEEARRHRLAASAKRP